MVITKIVAGLGNQMFQYAMGRAVTHRCGTELKLDTSAFVPGGNRVFELDRFRIDAAIASSEEIRAITGLLGTRSGPTARAVRRFCPRWIPVRHILTGSYVQERCFHFDPQLLSLRDNVYLHGRWQSEKYFSDIADAIRNEFQLKSIGCEDQELAQSMEADESSVSLHVRRGDYVTLSQQRRVYTSLSMEYYENAISYIRAQLTHPRFFIFSDEPQWVQANLHVKDAKIISVDGLNRGPRELILMTKCRHHIIANSTFSWWGAWLSVRRDGIVCAPRQWFAAEEQRRRCMDDLLPATWTKL